MLSCWCWHIYVQLCVFPCWFFLWVYKLPGLIMICLISDGIPEAGEECNFVGYRLASCWCGTLSNGMRWRFMITSDEEKLKFSGIRHAINLQRTSVVLCQVPWDGREYPQKILKKLKKMFSCFNLFWLSNMFFILLKKPCTIKFWNNENFQRKHVTAKILLKESHVCNQLKDGWYNLEKIALLVSIYSREI